MQEATARLAASDDISGDSTVAVLSELEVLSHQEQQEQHQRRAFLSGTDVFPTDFGKSLNTSASRLAKHTSRMP